MIRCTRCGAETRVFKTEQETKQINSRKFTMIRRKRKCTRCNARYSSVEVVESENYTWLPTIGGCWKA